MKKTKLILLLSLLALAWQKAPGQILLLSDGFESGAFDSKWTVTQPPTGVIDVENAVVLNGSYSARLNDASATGASGSLVGSFINTSNYSTSATISFKLQPNNSANFSGVVTLRNGLSGNVVQIRFLQSSNAIQYLNGATWTTLMSYTSGTTYDLGLDLDFTAHTYDVRIGGSLLLNDATMLNTSVTGIDRFQVQTGLVANSTGTFYLDDVAVSVVPEPGAAYLFSGFLLLLALNFRFRNSRRILPVGRA